MRIRFVLRQAALASPREVSVIYLIAHGSGLPDAEARVEAKQLMDRFSDRPAFDPDQLLRLLQRLATSF